MKSLLSFLTYKYGIMLVTTMCLFVMACIYWKNLDYRMWLGAIFIYATTAFFNIYLVMVSRIARIMYKNAIVFGFGFLGVATVGIIIAAAFYSNATYFGTKTEDIALDNFVFKSLELSILWSWISLIRNYLFSKKIKTYITPKKTYQVLLKGSNVIRG